MEQGTEETRIPLSASSREAMELASRRAIQRSVAAPQGMKMNAMQKSSGGTPQMSSVDLLAGVFLVHPNEGELRTLLEHAGVDLSTFMEELGRDGGFVRREGITDESRRMNESGFPVPRGEEVMDALRAADDLAASVNPETPRFIRLRDLFGGLLLKLSPASSLLRRLLAGSSMSLDDVCRSYQDFLRLPSSGNFYSDFLRERFPPIALPDYQADSTGETDLVGIGPEVNALAYLVAAKSLVPPLAIGLFGDWGSGKSFFMEGLKRRVNKITADARASGKPQREIDLYKYIVQVEFNAWHYVEGDLWASMVEHILRNLKRGIKDQPTELKTRQQYWIRKLRQARQTGDDFEKVKSQLEKELKESADRVRQADAELERSRRELQQLTVRDVWGAMKLTGEEEEEIKKVLQDTGITALQESTADLVGALEEGRDLMRRGNALLAPLRGSGRRGVIWVLAVVCVLLAGPLALAVASALSPQMSAVREVVTAITGTAGALAVAVAAANRWARKSLNAIEEVQKRLNLRKEKAEQELLRNIAEQRAVHAARTKELEEATKRWELKRNEIEELEKELNGVTPGRVLLDFINERVGSEDYRKHLGVAALIRNDFDKLSELIGSYNDEFEKTDDGSTTDPEADHRINRIILYIDDLDRCPPKRVVEVLQAVHLLMAFPLFVVVVAVDARWLSQSLLAHYEELLVGDHTERLEGRVRQATPDDYLEKIFQVPFWVKALPEGARVRMVEGLVEKGLVRDGGASGGLSGAGHGGGGGGEWNREEGEAPLRRETRTEFNPPGLKIQEQELEFMADLKHLLGSTPRSVKRFVNVYRLIKASAANQGDGFVSADPNADFRVVLFLLAVVTGLSSISRSFFCGLRRERPGSADGRVLSDLVASLAIDGGVAGTKLPDDSEAAVDARRLSEWIDGYRDGEWKSVSLEKLARWAPRVARFSYRIEAD